MQDTNPRGILSDLAITKLALEQDMIKPFVQEIVRKDIFTGDKMISYGLSSYGYDIRLAPDDFRVFNAGTHGDPINPKDFNAEHLTPAMLHKNEFGYYFIIPANSYALGVSLEKIKVPENVVVTCIGKSTYARCGIIANVTPLEAGWAGHVTLEFSNSSSRDAMVFANEGVLQLLFFEGEAADVPYNKRIGGGKYQDQGLEVTLPKV